MTQYIHVLTFNNQGAFGLYMSQLIGGFTAVHASILVRGVMYHQTGQTVIKAHFILFTRTDLLVVTIPGESGTGIARGNVAFQDGIIRGDDH